MLDPTSFLPGLGGPVALAVVMAIVFAESGLLAGFFLPGDSLLFTTGVLIAGGLIHVPLVVMLFGVLVAAVLGDQVGYTIGARLGPRLLNRPDSRFFARKHAERAQAFFEQHGPRAVLLARFVPVVRTFVPTLAGVGRMDRRRFTAYNLAGAALWSTAMLSAGHLLGGVALIADHVEVVTLGIVALSLLPACLAFLRGRARRRAPRPAGNDDDAPTGAPVGASW